MPYNRHRNKPTKFEFFRSGLKCIILVLTFLTVVNLCCAKLKHNVSTAVSSRFPQMSLVYPGIEMIQPGRSLVEFDLKHNASTAVSCSLP